MTTDPRQELTSRYDPHQIEGRIYEEWERSGCFTADPDAPGEPFTIVIPPPNVTGFLHIGHALNNTLQDILTRWHRMRGDNTLWVPGTDHAGIATQHVVERNLREKEGVDRRDLGREEFLKRVWQWKEEYGSRIIRQLKRLGCSCDWSRERFTMDEGLSRAVATVFKRLFDEGLIYRGDYLVNWSPRLQTALSDDEVVHKEVQGHLWHFKYPLEAGGEIVVATTRPETMLGDTAVAVHPDDPRYAHLHGTYVLLPLMNRRIPIITDALVEKDFGTGAVKVTPAHDPNDYDMGKRHGLEFINLLNPDGTLNDNAGEYAGLPTAEARKKVVAAMDALGLLEKIEPHTHSVGHCYRSDCVVEPYLSNQWFVRMRPLCGPAIDAVRDGRIEFIPKHYENIYFNWLENVRDWCISRQLWWGHRIPIFECFDCGHVWCEIDQTPERCPKCASFNIAQDPDVLDTWFSSQLWPFSTLGWPEQTKDLARYYPTNVLVTGFDIIFFWVARMIVSGLKFMDDIPFSKVMINPIVRDEHGKKMSKSTGNAIDPLDVIDELGADTMRLALCGYPMQSRHISLSEKQFERMRNFCNKLWNAARFVLMNTEDLPAEALTAVPDQPDLQPEDRWILSALRRTIEQTDAALTAFAIDAYLDGVYKFIWNEYCDWYVELVKDRLYQKGGAQGRGSDASRRAAQATLVTVLENVLRLLHPVAPFITEEIWQQIRERWGTAGDADGRLALTATTIMKAAWPSPASFAADAEAEGLIALTQNAIGAIRNIRGEMAIPPSETTHVEILTESPDTRARLASGEHYLRSLLRIGELHFAANPVLTGFTAVGAFDDVVVHVELPQALLDQEKARLDKEIARLGKGIAGARGKLGNDKFTSGAPEAVVQAEREKLEKMETEQAALEAKRKTLGK